ncbi:MAG: tetratricopeptide repeat protein [Alphaproteobacteria bacterium]|nr:tetratricopeptide repeat protein [Alphaproteobacteria bacterium]
MTEPSLAEAMAHHAAGRLAEAVRIYQAILARSPGNADALAGLGVAALTSGRPEVAHPLLAEAARRKRDDAIIHNNLANAAKALGDAAAARLSYRRAVALAPSVPELIANLAGGLDGGEASRWARRAVRLAPGDPDGWFVLALGTAAESRLGTAVGALARSLALDPARAAAWFNRANALRDLGEVEAAVVHYRRAVALEPDNDGATSNLLFALSFVADDAAIAAANRTWGRRIEATAAPAAFFDNDRDGERRLVVGYLSPDFRKHQFLMQLRPLLEHHDRGKIRLIAYADVSRPDAETERLKPLFETWRDIHSLDDTALDRQIRSDGVDVLVCVTGYLATYRRRFVPRRAPVQVAAINQVSSPGLDAFDARITDRWLDPPEFGDRGPERLVRLASGFAVFQSPAEAPPVSALPALSMGHITFGCFNNLAKMTDRTLDLFCRVLDAVPGSRLRIKAMALSDEEPRQRFLARARRAGLDLGHLDLQGRVYGDPANLAALARADIALDPTPFCGGLSSADALWMGVPLVSLAGPSLVGRLGASMLARAGLSDLIAKSPDDYVRIAAGLAGDLPRLAALRGGMRHRLAQASLSNGRIFAMEMERVYRDLWRQWCRT